ncbi:carbon storage regulator [Pseudomonas plecoglossicida]|uniref:Translational regulator CsrA n=1 Tax=Pseudomonas plecoglossicida TaxID=70775 RepID=A0AAD0QW76_PSEDL|nr:carbon storage regulator [Pseudomonas plecoglossicida]AXM95995.1 carbon storage regulator [Pseudomonas plecoglossicida]EPB97743.1 carbon storage regulator CsrA [Pseudomonas plecoglossicida NB2011]QLB56753.1 carbon storage regulator [Pseudomonas plecoglossicida]
MLVIGREVGEVIVIDDHIQIKVVETRDGSVRFGVSAPRDVPVHRAEVYKRIKAGEVSRAPIAGKPAPTGTPQA